MGNKSTNTRNNIGYGKLKMQKYPVNILEEHWVPSESCDKSKQNKETKVSGAPNGDGRVRAKPSDYVNNAIYNIVRLKMDFNGTIHTCGSGVIIHCGLNKAFILTAAHNVVYEDGNDKLHYPTSTWIEINKNKSNGFQKVKVYKCSEYMVHPKYIEFLQKDAISESDTGYDIAIIQAFDPQNELKNIKPITIRTFSSKISDDMKIKVIGYPGEKQLRGELYGMKGDGKVKKRSDKSPYNQLIVYQNIDTTHGQSGCPIFRILDNEEKECDEKYNDNVFGSFDEIIGIHVLGKRMKQSNFGTMLSDEILKWIHEYIDGDCIEYDADSCAVSVLLITSSKSQYAYMLDQIHEKCIKTKIMTTMKLYYDHNQESVEKQHFLWYVKRMFEKIRTRYLIFYCGQSDENGNWIINDKKYDNVTLDDISRCAK
eukprot:45851_1